jgi:hypothetical protein
MRVVQRVLVVTTFTPWPASPGVPEPFYDRLTLWSFAVIFAAATVGLFGLLAGSAFSSGGGGDSSGGGGGGGGGSHRHSAKRRARRRREQTNYDALRLLLAIALYALPAPIVGNLASPLMCLAGGESSGAQDAQTWAGLECWQPAHSGVFALSFALLVPYVALLLTAAALLVARSPTLVKFPLAQAHGRAEVAGQALRIAMTLIFVAGGDLAPGVRAAAFMLGGAALSALSVRYLPYYDMPLNRLLAAGHAVLASSGAMTLLALLLGGEPAVAVTIAGMLWAFLTPLTSFAAYELVGARWRAAGLAKVSASPFAFELRLRANLLEVYVMLRAPKLKRSIEEEGEGVSASWAAEASSSSIEVGDGSGGAGAGEGSGALPDGGGRWPAGAVCPAGFTRRANTRIPTANDPPVYGIFNKGLALAAPPAAAAMLETIEIACAEGLRTFPGSALVRLTAAHVMRALRGNEVINEWQAAARSGHIKGVVEQLLTKART